MIKFRLKYGFITSKAEPEPCIAVVPDSSVSILACKGRIFFKSDITVLKQFDIAKGSFPAFDQTALDGSEVLAAP